MFTGLVADRGIVGEVRREGDGARITVESTLAGAIRAGDSVAINGVCLTAREADGRRFGADVMNETLERSSLGGLAPGARVNLELSLRVDDRLGGHVVQGHVDGLGTVSRVSDDGFARRLEIGAGPEILRYVVEKGSIAVDGVSLTVTGVDEESFAVSLIPETLARTTLGAVEPGQRVNLEVDVLAKYVERLIGTVRA